MAVAMVELVEEVVAVVVPEVVVVLVADEEATATETTEMTTKAQATGLDEALAQMVETKIIERVQSVIERLHHLVDTVH